MKPHAFDPVSLAGGLLFIALGVIAATVPVFDLPDIDVLGPVVLGLLGLLLVSSAVRAASTSPQAAARAVTPDPAPDQDPARDQDPAPTSDPAPFEDSI